MPPESTRESPKPVHADCTSHPIIHTSRHHSDTFPSMSNTPRIGAFSHRVLVPPLFLAFHAIAPVARSMPVSPPDTHIPLRSSQGVGVAGWHRPPPAPLLSFEQNAIASSHDTDSPGIRPAVEAAGSSPSPSHTAPCSPPFVPPECLSASPGHRTLCRTQAQIGLLRQLLSRARDNFTRRFCSGSHQKRPGRDQTCRVQAGMVNASPYAPSPARFVPASRSRPLHPKITRRPTEPTSVTGMPNPPRNPARRKWSASPPATGSAWPWRREAFWRRLGLWRACLVRSADMAARCEGSGRCGQWAQSLASTGPSRLADGTETSRREGHFVQSG